MSTEVAQPGIVVGIDGSPHSNAALRWAVNEAMMRNAALTLVYAAAPIPAGSPMLKQWPGGVIPAEFLQQLEGRARQVLAEAVTIVEDMTEERSRPPISSELISKPPVPTLVDLSAKADMVVVGSRGQGAVKRVLLGSVSTGLVHHAHCPVAVIRDEAAAPPHGPVLVGIDGSPASELATAIAFDEASWRGTELVALYAWTDAEIPDMSNREWTGLTRTSWSALQSAAEETLAERLAGWRERYPDVTVHRVVVPNRPAQHLLERADSAQLVVVGSHGRGGFAGMLLGSVSTAVVHAAHTPVIVARRG
ncbi:universal stress protein [Mycobacterium sp. SM1]|uniref:universal stress protein n=1 Tax=Mycobacterium sp. SM1 TaxID=2816243 RepID=UPI001BCCE8B5|nr:universal stress protein [Mycobacterium sp. SM1]MBS4730467.1 universal stress protein [Mycobacterium sp. SM1]